MYEGASNFLILKTCIPLKYATLLWNGIQPKAQISSWPTCSLGPISFTNLTIFRCNTPSDPLNCSKRLGYHAEQQYSTLELTKAEHKRRRYLPLRLDAHRYKKCILPFAFFKTSVTCSLKFKHWSKITPRYLTDVTRLTNKIWGSAIGWEYSLRPCLSVLQILVDN